MSTNLEQIEVRSDSKLYPVSILIDTSGSMEYFETDLQAAVNSLTTISALSEKESSDVLITLVTFNNSVEIYDTVSLNNFVAPSFKTGGATRMGKALEDTLNRTDEIIHAMSEIKMNRPAIFLISDGLPTDDVKKSIKRLKESHVQFFAFGLNKESVAALTKISPNKDAFLIDCKSGESPIVPFIEFVSQSITKVSQSQAGTDVQLAIPENVQYVTQMA